VRRLRQALEPGMDLRLPLYARRSLFRRHGSLLLVTDVFLPALGKLMALNIDAF